MNVFGLPPQFGRLAQHPPLERSVRARDRLRALGLWQETGDIALVGRTFGVSRATLYRWRARCDPQDPASLEERSRRPRRVRRPQWARPLVEAVRRWREAYPRWGRDKPVVWLRREGFGVSASTLGRILAARPAHGGRDVLFLPGGRAGVVPHPAGALDRPGANKAERGRGGAPGVRPGPGGGRRP